MKYFVPVIVLLLLPCISQAQQSNPFKSIGKTAKVQTLSNGKYVESFDDDVLQRVGTVVINRRTKKIVELLDADKVNSASSDNSTASRWYGIDPLAEKYYSISPYAFCANNPIKYIDPDGRELQLPGGQKAQDGYRQMLYTHTGNRYSITNNVLKLDGADANFAGKKSTTLAAIIDKAMQSSTVYSLSLVGEKKDDKNVFIDSYNDKKIDMSDLGKLGAASPALQGAAIGHFLNEIQDPNGFQTAHSTSLGVEGKIYGELVGDASIIERKDYTTAGASNGSQTVIYEYNATNKFELEQGATSKEVPGFTELNGVRIPTKTVTTQSTGELKSVKKVP